MDYVTFFEERKMYVTEILECGKFSRDYGVRQETVKIEAGNDFEKFLTRRKNEWETMLKEVEDRFLELSTADSLADVPSEPKRKRRKKSSVHPQMSVKQDPFASYAAEFQVMFFKRVCCDWRDIALTIRDRVFEEGEEQLIDMHDVKCKEWGFLLKKLCGVHLGTGDYGHLVIDHSAMLLRQFRSLYKYSGQGFEASHKLHRNLYSKATNHDASAPGQSLDQILTHWFSTMLLSLRYSFREAKNSIMFGRKKFSFRGCGWKAIDSRKWSKEHRDWILTIDNLFNQIFGGDFLVYVYDKNKGTSVDENIVTGLLDYNHDSWEAEYLNELSDFSDKVTESNAPMQNCGPKQLDFADAKTAPVPSSTNSDSSEDKDEAGQTNSFNKGRATHPCTLTALSLTCVLASTLRKATHS